VNVACLPWPHKLLSPNARCNPILKSRAVKTHRALAMALGSQDRRKRLQIPVCGVLPIVTTRRRRDLDNVLAGLKAAFDGLTDAGWWSDDSDIVSITIRKPLYIRSWDRDPIVIVADDECNEREMLARLERFRMDAPTDPSAWETLIAHR